MRLPPADASIMIEGIIMSYDSTRDAEQLYARAGFTPGSGPVVYMERRPEKGPA